MTAWRLCRHDTLTSTSDALIAQANAGEPKYAAVLADHQTHGRGSRGRTWASLPGALNLSILVRPSPLRPNMIALQAGIALWDALVTIPGLPRSDLVLKWPNDVLLANRKLAGILIETSSDGANGWAVIGFGVNLAHAPDLPGRPATSVAAHTPHPAADDFAPVVLDAFARWDQVVPPALRVAWLDRSVAIGTLIRFRRDGMDIEGCFAGLDEDGALQMRHNGQVRRYATGEIMMRHPCCL